MPVTLWLPWRGGDFVNGKQYQYNSVIRYADTANGAVQYAFSATDGADTAIGEPVQWHGLSVLSVANSPAFLEWVTDSADCRIDSAKPGLTLKDEPISFKVKYTDVDDWGAGPTSVRVLVDLNGNGVYDGVDETVDMIWVSAGSDNDWRNGEYYVATGVTPTASGTLKYRFEATDVGFSGSQPMSAIGDAATVEKHLTIHDYNLSARGVRKSPISSGPVWYNDVQSAIDAVNGAHTVLVMDGTYTQNIRIETGNDNDTTLKSICGADLTTLKATSSDFNAIFLHNLSSTNRTTIDGFSDCIEQCWDQ